MFSCMIQLGYNLWFKEDSKEATHFQAKHHTHEGHALFEENNDFVADVGIVKDTVLKTDLS